MSYKVLVAVYSVQEREKGGLAGQTGLGVASQTLEPAVLALATGVYVLVAVASHAIRANGVSQC